MIGELCLLFLIFASGQKTLGFILIGLFTLVFFSGLLIDNKKDRDRMCKLFTIPALFGYIYGAYWIFQMLR